jgi:peptide/nickel transport system substrate-binding protein
MRRAILGAAAAGAALVLVAGVAEAQTPKRGGVLNFGVVAEPPNYDCHGSTTFALIHPVAPHYSLLV